MMFRIRSALVLAAFACGPLLPTGSAVAQSLLASRGLGYPIEPTDARSRGFGGVALGLPEPDINWANPAASLGLAVPGLVFAYMHDSFSTQLSGEESDGETARFPLLLAAFPISEKVVVLAGYGGLLDQNWRTERGDTLRLGGDTIAVVDQFSATGGAARLRAGAAYAITESLGVGAAVDLYTGSLERMETRHLKLAEALPGIFRARWKYSGLGWTASGQWTPSTALAVAASLTAGGTLEAENERREAVEEEEESEQIDVRPRSFDMPLSFQIGASGRVGAQTLVAIGAGWSGWSSLDGALQEQGGARDSWSLHGGVEWEGISLRDRPIPLRIGARTAALPFRWAPATDSGWANERALTTGAGIVLAGGAARTDLALEVGSRTADQFDFEESFWRFALSVRVLGR